MVETMSDPYEVLGIRRHASAEEVRRGYREKVKACHPDLGKEPGRMETFKQVNQAYRLILGVLEQEKQRNEEASPPSPDDQEAAGGDTKMSELIRAVEVSYADGQMDEAEAILRLAAQRYPRSAPVYILMAKVLVAQERFAEAIGCLTLALEWEPRSEPARTMLDRIRRRD